MANVKISDLPLYSASVNPDIYLVNNNSGETETFKIQLKTFNGMTSTNGNNAIQSNSWLTALGTTASTESAIAIGNGAEATSPYSIAIGYMARNTNRDGARNNYICIGTNSQAVQESFALGTDAKAFGADTCSIGKNAGTYGNSSLALGKDSLAYSTGGVALGRNAFDASNNYGTALGSYAQVDGDYSVAIGYGARAQGIYSVSIGGSGHTNVGINSTIIGGNSNQINVATTNRGLILNSKNCKIEKDGQYSSTNVNYIGCENVGTENLTDVMFLNVKNIDRNNGGYAPGTTVVQNSYTLGASLFSATTYASTGATTNIVVDPLQQSHIEIDTDGSTTYNISFTLVDSAVYAQMTFYINYVSGSTINFVSAGSTQWRWANGSAPSFTGTNRNIIVVSSWDNDDVWEVSRSMYM